MDIVMKKHWLPAELWWEIKKLIMADFNEKVALLTEVLEFPKLIPDHHVHLKFYDFYTEYWVWNMHFKNNKLVFFMVVQTPIGFNLVEYT